MTETTPDELHQRLMRTLEPPVLVSVRVSTCGEKERSRPAMETACIRPEAVVTRSAKATE
jgi:hypothetical protein